jgi:ATP-dependent Clp protease ATP-binding subunit ClpC
MFERYTERARRVIFFARYEASQFGSTSIESEHLLLGLLREDKNVTNRFLHDASSVKSIRQEIENRSEIREKITTSIDLPLTAECKRILAYSAEEAEKLRQGHIGTEHILLGMLREENCSAAKLLTGRGLRVDSIREELAREPMPAETESAFAGRLDAIRTRLGGIRAGLFPSAHSPALPAAGAVPDAETAIRIAEAIWLPIYGAEAIEKHKPIQAELKYGVIWIVSGSLQKTGPEAPISAFILKADGRILALGQDVPNGPSKS